MTSGEFRKLKATFGAQVPDLTGAKELQHATVFGGGRQPDKNISHARTVFSLVNHVNVNPNTGNGPTQGQRNTLTRVGIELTTFGLDHCSTD